MSVDSHGGGFSELVAWQMVRRKGDHCSLRAASKLSLVVPRCHDDDPVTAAFKKIVKKCDASDIYLVHQYYFVVDRKLDCVANSHEFIPIVSICN